MARTRFILATLLIAASTGNPALAQVGRPYRLSSVDLKQSLIWGAECRRPDGTGLAFGGQDQDAVDGRPHTRVLVDGQWNPIHEQLRSANPLQEFHARAWALRCDAKDVRARARFIYFKGLPTREESESLQKEVVPGRKRIADEISIGNLDPRIRIQEQMMFETITGTTRHILEVEGSPFSWTC